MLNDEESIQTFELPAELDPVLSYDSFNQVCFIYSLNSSSSSSKELISSKHCRGKPCNNILILDDSDASFPVTLTFILGMIAGHHQSRARTIVACRSPDLIKRQIGIL